MEVSWKIQGKIISYLTIDLKHIISQPKKLTILIFRKMDVFSLSKIIGLCETIYYLVCSAESLRI